MHYLRTTFSAFTVAIVATLGAVTTPALAEDPAFLSFGAGSYDWNRQKDEGVEVRLEYRHGKKILGPLKPFVAAAASQNGSTQVFLGVGVLMDIYFGNRIVVTPSFAPLFHHGGNKNLDLDYALEFRSQMELAYRFDDRSRLGMSMAHTSNGSLGKTNPGTESLVMYYSYPVDFFK